LNAKRKRDLQGRRVEVLGKQAREVPRSYSETIGQCFDIAPIKRSVFDERQCTLDSRPGTLPSRTEWSRLRPAAEARSITRVFCSSSAAIKPHVP
jgi:hypothetical protein